MSGAWCSASMCGRVCVELSGGGGGVQGSDASAASHAAAPDPPYPAYSHNRRGLPRAGAIHGDKSQREREYLLDQFRRGRTGVMVGLAGRLW